MQTLALQWTEGYWEESRLLRDTVLVVAGSLVMAALAQVSVPLPFTPVPITGQTFGVLVVGASLGARRGAASMAAYLLQGTAGLPVFAGGAMGAFHLIGPTGGYLVGFVVAAYLVGRMAEMGWDRRWITALPMLALGEAVIFALGLAWLSRFVPLEQAFVAGLLPFLPGSVVKLALAAIALRSAWAVTPRK